MNRKPPVSDGKRKASYLPYIIVASILYFVISVGWLLAQNISIVLAVIISAVTFIVMSGAFFFLAPFLRNVETKPDSDPMKTTLFGKSEGDGADNDVPDKQNEYRHQMWVEGLKREAVKKQDSILRMFAVLSALTLVFGTIMHSAFGLDPMATFMVPLWAVALIWYLQIALLPRWMTYTSFFTMVIMRLGIQIFGLGIISVLPNFIMLPVFYLLMMFFMYGSIMLPQLAQIKYFKPGQGGWEVPKGATRGQFGARAMVETQIDRFVRYSMGLSNRKPSRGMVFTGPPGTGKTLLANEIASGLRLPFVQADASAFTSPFMGFGPLIPLIVRARTEALAREFGGAIFFIDEGEMLFGARSGMQQPSQYKRQVDVFDVLDKSGTLTYDNPEIRTREWNEQQMALAAEKAPTTEGKHNVFMMPGGMGGGNAAIYPFLTWMSGTNSAPIMQRTTRNIVNTLLNSLFIVPVTAFGKVLRLPPAKAIESNVMFITATNRFWMFDPAMIRPGRFAITAEFVIPDEDERVDTATYYLKQWHKKGYYQDDLLRPERILEFAQATPNTSQAEIEQMIVEAVDIRVQFVAELRRLKNYADEGKTDELLENDRKLWTRYKGLVYANGNEIVSWDDERVDWQALMETKSSISFGRANPNAVNETTKRKVEIHEFGHFVALNSFNGKKIKPVLLTVIPRRGNLGMVAHIPHDTREQNPQEYYEGLIRTSLAAWVAEHYFFGQNLPGVSGDLKNATNIACLMIATFGMSTFTCTKKEAEYFAEIGNVLISEPETSMFNPMATALLESVLKSHELRRQVAVILGMAAVDDYRLIRRNENIFLDVIPEFHRLNEFSGNLLTELWQKLDRELVPLNKMDNTHKRALPMGAFTVNNPFYGDLKPEGQRVYDQITAQIGETS